MYPTTWSPNNWNYPVLLLTHLAYKFFSCQKWGLDFNYYTCIFVRKGRFLFGLYERLINILLHHCAFLTLKVWLAVGCAAMACRLCRCGLQLKPSLLWAPWYLLVSRPEVCLLSKHRLQEGGAGSSPRIILTEELMDLEEPQLGQEDPPLAEDRLWHQHPLEVNFHSPPGGESKLEWMLQNESFCSGKRILNPFWEFDSDKD